MTAYQFTCPCGHIIKAEAATRNEAVSSLKTLMDKAAIAAHFKEKHPGQDVLPVSAVHNMIEQGTVAA